VIGQTLAMEGVFSFFLESSFLGVFLFGEKRLKPRAHWFAALLLFLGAWLSGYFIVATDAWMQHPVGFTRGATGSFELASFWALLLNPWALWQYAHTMMGAVQTGCFTMAAVGAYYLLENKHRNYGEVFLRTAIITGVIASILQLFPTGDAQGVMIAHYQRPTLAGMEGLFEGSESAPLAILGQPDVARRRLDNPLVIPGALSFLTYRSWAARVDGLDSFALSEWPDNLELLYYSYHVMVGLGTIFIAILAISAFLLYRSALFRLRAMLWVLMLALPFPLTTRLDGSPPKSVASLGSFTG
jgi:cytochrome d ubiquinol oxidase subunit I